jgi:DNA modification methylase
MSKPPSIPSRVRAGDTWLLGRHRLTCGDAGSAKAVEAATAGSAAQLLVTSPPYGDQRAYTTGGIGDWNALMQGVFRTASRAVAPDGQILVNLGLIHREGEWQPYWSAWLDWMRTQGWRRFGLYTWDQGPGLPGDWNGRLAPSFELVFHLNRVARRPNKIVPCRWAGQVKTEKGGLRNRDGSLTGWCHASRPVQSHRIPDSVIRITRQKARGLERGHPAVFPIALPAFLIESYAAPDDLVLDPFGGAGSTLLAAERTGRRAAIVELAPSYCDIALARWEQAHPDQPAVRERRYATARGVTSTTISRTALVGPEHSPETHQRPARSKRISATHCPG